MGLEGGLVSSDSRRLETTPVSDPGSWFDGHWYRPSQGDYRSANTKAEEVARFEFALAQILDEAEALLLSKQKDYGPDNIAKSPFGPLFGLLVRMYDKQARAANLISKDVKGVVHEPLEDTFLDLLNYSAIALMVLRGQWPGVKEGQW